MNHIFKILNKICEGNQRRDSRMNFGGGVGSREFGREISSGARALPTPSMRRTGYNARVDRFEPRLQSGYLQNVIAAGRSADGCDAEFAPKTKGKSLIDA
jgi:hypothetical protein